LAHTPTLREEHATRHITITRSECAVRACLVWSSEVATPKGSAEQR